MTAFDLISRVVLRRVTVTILAASMVLFGLGSTHAQQPSPPQQKEGDVPAGPAAPITALVEQLVDLFPRVQGEVLEVKGSTLTLDIGRKDGVHAGLSLEVYRQGREIQHPRTGAVLGRAEQTIGTVRITDVQESFSTGQLVQAAEAAPSDRVRLPSSKIRLTLLPLSGGIRENLVEAATNDLVERLNGSGRFQVMLGDAINVYLSG